MQQLGHAVLTRAIDFVESLPNRPAVTTGIDPAATASLVQEMLAPPPHGPGVLADVLARVDRATACAIENAGPGFLGYVPGGGLFASAVAELYAGVTNRFVGLAAAAPALAAMEYSVVRWLCDVCGIAGGSGLLTSGGSMANFSATVAARHVGLGEDLGRGSLYLSTYAHHSLTKAAMLAGLPRSSIRIVPVRPDLRMDVVAAARMIADDRAAGRTPFLVIGSAGTTDTGTIDPLPELASLAEREGLWFHVDGAYGGLFRLTDRGRDRLRGLERADSVTLDPHKSLFLPHGTGALVVRDVERLRQAHAVAGHALADLAANPLVPDFADMGPELTREMRGLRVWLPLHLYGVAAFSSALDEKLDLARQAYEKLASVPVLDVREPDLTVVAFRWRVGAGGYDTPEQADRASERLLGHINASGRILLSSTMVEDRFTVRLCILSHRTHAERVAEAVDIICAAAVKAGNLAGT